MRLSEEAYAALLAQRTRWESATTAVAKIVDTALIPHHNCPSCGTPCTCAGGDPKYKGICQHCRISLHRPGVESTAALPISATAGASKYRNVKTDGYASKKEAKRASVLRLMQEAGQIADLREQVPYVLIPTQRDAAGGLLERSVRFLADFVYVRDGQTICEDVKGYRDGSAYAMFVVKRKLMLFVHRIRVVEV